MQAIPMILMAGSKIVSGIAANKAGQANKRAADAQALEEEAAAAAQELQIRDTARKAIGQQAAAQASNGFSGDSGSALDALAESQINMLVDVMRVRRDAAGKARSLRAEGAMAATQGKFGLIEGLLGAGSAAMSARNDWAAARPGGGSSGGGSSGGGGKPAPAPAPSGGDGGKIIVTRGK